MEIRTGTLTFARGRGNGPRSQSQFFNFDNSVRQAVAGLTGTNFGFSPRDDHHLGLVNVRLVTSIDDDVVNVEGILGVREWSNDWDDDYEGTVQFTLLVDLETGSAPSNLSITGVEYNQTVQFFRTTLAPPNARSDNSVGLIAGKNTVVRVVLATEGIRTGSAKSDSFSVPRRPAQAVVQRIDPDAMVYPGQTITFVGEALSAEGGVAKAADLRWSSDVAGDFAVGQEARYTPRRPGRHRIRLTAPDRCGGECYAEVELEVKKYARHTHTSEDDPAHTSKDHESGKIPYRRKGEHDHGN